jgi:hypothetical protein
LKEPIDRLLFCFNFPEKISDDPQLVSLPDSDISLPSDSTLFLVPKKNDKMRPVINLKPLNGYLKKTHFKMDTLSKVIIFVKTLGAEVDPKQRTLN